jgi:antirestriction protein ArdC
LPPDVAFSSAEYFSATAIHEIGHSTGHETRMKRDLTGTFGSESYSLEEARVEMTAAFVCNTLNLPTDFQNHAAYVDGWLKKLRKDERELLRCCADAQKIATWVLDYHPDWPSYLNSFGTNTPKTDPLKKDLAFLAQFVSQSLQMAC